MNPENRVILPGMAFRGFASRYQRPATSEGFQDITEVEFTVRHCLCIRSAPCPIITFSTRVNVY